MPLLSNMEFDRMLIGGLTAGKKWASGSGISNSTQGAFTAYYNGGIQTATVYFYMLYITGLSFNPSLVVAVAGSTLSLMQKYVNMATNANTDTFIMWDIATLERSVDFLRLASIGLVSGGAQIPVVNGNTAYTWYAFE